MHTADDTFISALFVRGDVATRNGEQTYAAGRRQK